jgi:hypothetical protein
MSRTPTVRELEVLRYLAAGMYIQLAPTKQRLHPVIAKNVTVISIQPATLTALYVAGWVDAKFAGKATITHAGRDVAECKTFVRAFAEGAQP